LVTSSVLNVAPVPSLAFRGLLIIGTTLSLMSPAAAQKPAQAGTPKPAQQTGREQAKPPRAGLQTFDCTSADEMKRGESLRGHHSGGPDGATWNWYGADLVCTVVVRGSCDGTGRVVLELGRKPAARAEITLSEKDATTQELRVPSRVWERALQRRKTLVFETLLLHVRIDPKCADGSRASPAGTWSDSFVGAFSGGE
jgi:hypothetical protein